MVSWGRLTASARLRLRMWLLLLLVSGATARPATILSSNGTAVSNPSDARVYCEKTGWQDICWFFFSNYILHALSVRSLPGENFFSSTVFKFCCLLVPYTGVRRGLCLISRASNLATDDLQAAARANALCFVVRRPDWRPIDGDKVIGSTLTERAQGSSRPSPDTSLYEKKDPRGKDNSQAVEELRLYVKDLYNPPEPSSLFDRFTKWLIATHRFKEHKPNLGGVVDLDAVKLQGYCRLVPGYGLSYVPSNMKIYPRQARPESHSRFYRFNPFDSTTETKIASTHDVPRILFSLVQTISGGWALYKARGSQIDRYGFASFGLTVSPYIVVSIINFVGSLLTSEYEMVYMVHSSTMDEMIARGGCIDGAVGSLEEPGDHMSSVTKITTEGRIFSFQEDGNSLHCRASGEDSHRLILPREEPVQPPKVTLKERLRHGQFFLKSAKPPSHEPRKRLSWKQHLLRGHFWLRTPRYPPPTEDYRTPCILISSQPSFTQLPIRKVQPFLNALAFLLLVIAIAAPWFAMGFLSGFRANHSTSTQRNFVLIWLVAGQIQGYAVSHVERHMDKKTALKGLITVFLSYGSNCLCGLVIVAQQMVEFGTCKSVD